ncbi:polyphosphate kinase 2, partial [Rhodococcus sp. IITD102]
MGSKSARKKAPNGGHVRKRVAEAGELHSPAAEPGTPAKKPMKNKEYLRRLKPLQGELVAMQEWVRSSGAKVCILFEGRDTAGKG